MDRISYLPYPIREHIVNFLPMEDAFRTQVLSTRWKDSCSSISSLKFDQDDFEARIGEKIDFLDFVYQALLLHDGSDVKKFELAVSFDDSYAHHLSAWISFLVRHNVQELNLSLLGKLEVIPMRLFTCTSLTKLALFGTVGKVPQSIRFPMLKSMSLDNVWFDNVSQLNQILSSSPLLEYLSFWRCCWWDHSGTIVIDAPKLKLLKLLFGNPSPAVKISASNLTQINYAANPPDMSLDTLPTLVKAKFICFTSSLVLTRIATVRTANIVMGLRNIVSLYLNSFCVEYLTGGRDLLLHMPTCCSLKDLSLLLFPSKAHLRVSTFLFKIYPNLQTLKVAFHHIGASTYVPNVEEQWESEEFSPQGSLNQLRVVDVDWFGGGDIEVDLLRHLVENANVMEKMNIMCSVQLAEEDARQTSISEKLAEFNKASPGANISFPAPHVHDESSEDPEADARAAKIMRKLENQRQEDPVNP